MDFSAQALTQARAQAAAMGVRNASFRTGELTATGLPGASADAVLRTDAIQFPGEAALALRSFHDEGVRSVERAALLRRVLAVATRPG